MERNGIQKKDPERADKGALNGLRGLFAFHVMIYHACVFLGDGFHPKLNLYANVDMPLFFLLSGFSLTLAYGRTNWDRSSLSCCNNNQKVNLNVTDVENLDVSPKIFNSWEFYKKRLIRILPLHYLGTILVLIVWKFGVWPAGDFDVWIATGLSAFAINTWLLPFKQLGPNGPSWTICTLFFWYWCFPLILPRVQRLTDRDLARGIVRYFWLSVGISVLVAFGLGAYFGREDEITYWMICAHPLFRFPVFVMGILGGLQVLRAQSNWEKFEDPNQNRNILHILIPWGFCGKREQSATDKVEDESLNKKKNINIWRKRVDISAAFYILILVSLSATQAVLEANYTGTDRNFYIDATRNENGSFTWPNGTVDDFNRNTYWETGEPNNFGGSRNCSTNCRENCAAFLGMFSDDFKWFDVPCSSELRVICSYDQINEINCSEEGFNSNCFEEKYYNVSDYLLPYQMAKQSCVESGGTLVISNNINTTKFIVGLIRSKSTSKLNDTIRYIFGSDKFWAKFLQVALVHLHLNIIIGLCMDNGNSFTSKLLRTRIMQFLGRISLSLYLTHWSTMGFILTAINGPQKYQTDAEIWNAYRIGKLVQPPGLPVVAIVLSPVIAYIVTKYFEEPLSKALRGTK